MKKFLLMTMALLASVITFAQNEVTIDFTAQDYENAQEVTSLVQDGVTVTFDKGTNSNTPKYYTAGTAVRVYGGGTMKLESESKITKIDITFGSGDNSNEITVDNGTYEEGAWTGSANDVTFTVGSTSGHRRIQKLAVTLADDATATVLADIAALTR